jgi:hypothetical protein
MIETLLSGVFGGALRLAPEVIKLFDRKNERNHELALLKQEHEFAKMQAETQLRVGEQNLVIREFDTLDTALDEQGKTARAAGWFISAVSALVRPVVTYLFLAMYFLVKVALYSMALDQGGAWQEVIVQIWTKDDISILFMIISFWFVGRVYERNQR